MKKILFPFLLVIAIIVIFGGYQYFFSVSDDVVVSDVVVDEVLINVVEINKELANGTSVLLDVRTDEELAEDGYAPKSIHFDVVRLDEGEVPNISKDKKIYVYCRSGGRAGRAEEILENNGYSDVVNIGGLVDWEAAGGEVLK